MALPDKVSRPASSNGTRQPQPGGTPDDETNRGERGKGFENPEPQAKTQVSPHLDSILAGHSCQIYMGQGEGSVEVTTPKTPLNATLPDDYGVNACRTDSTGLNAGRDPWPPGEGSGAQASSDAPLADEEARREAKAAAQAGGQQEDPTRGGEASLRRSQGKEMAAEDDNEEVKMRTPPQVEAEGGEKPPKTAPHKREGRATLMLRRQLDRNGTPGGFLEWCFVWAAVWTCMQICRTWSWDERRTSWV